MFLSSFGILIRDTMSNLQTNPGNYSTLIKSITETAFQRAIILGGKSIIDNELVEWLDIELPVDRHRRARGHCVDLIGRSISGYIICELKFGSNSATDSPSEANKQLNRYKIDIEYNYSILDRCNVHHKNGKPFLWKDIANNARYIIAANDQYWEYWLEHRNEAMPTDESCYSINIDKDCFKQQKGTNVSYTPHLPQYCIWHKLEKGQYEKD